MIYFVYMETLLSIHFFDALGLFLFLAGLIIGLGAVTVIDIHGFLGRKSSYWTEATTRTHKVTKPMIWLGIFLALIGGSLLYRDQTLSGIPLYHLMLACVLVLNGIFLSFSVSPYMLRREKEGKAKELLPAVWQKKIAVSLVFSDIGWWGSVILLVVYLLTH
jgi:hypothetical protein